MSAPDLEAQVQELADKWVYQDPDSGELVDTDAQTLVTLSIKAQQELAVLRRVARTVPANKIDFREWMLAMGERYYLTDAEVTAIISEDPDKVNYAMYYEWEALHRWWLVASTTQTGRSMSDWHDGLGRVLMRMNEWRSRKATKSRGLARAKEKTS